MLVEQALSANSTKSPTALLTTGSTSVTILPTSATQQTSAVLESSKTATFASTQAVSSATGSVRKADYVDLTAGSVAGLVIGVSVLAVFITAMAFWLIARYRRMHAKGIASTNLDETDIDETVKSDLHSSGGYHKPDVQEISRSSADSRGGAAELS